MTEFSFFEESSKNSCSKIKCRHFINNEFKTHFLSEFLLPTDKQYTKSHSFPMESSMEAAWSFDHMNMHIFWV